MLVLDYDVLWCHHQNYNFLSAVEIKETSPIINRKYAAPVWDVFVGVWINVLLGQTKVHNEHHLVLLHAGPTSQVQIRNV